MLNKENKIPVTKLLPDKSTEAESVNQPTDFHCHCPPLVVGVNADGSFITATHYHAGKGGWWKNDKCTFCDDLTKD